MTRIEQCEMTTPTFRQFLRMRMMPPQTMFTKRMDMSRKAPGRGIFSEPTSSMKIHESKYFFCTS